MLQQGGAASSSLGVVDDAAAIELAKELALNDTTATELDLSAQEVGNAGATALAAALETNTTLTLLDLAINKVGAAGTLTKAAHRRLMSTGAGRSPPDPGMATVR